MGKKTYSPHPQVIWWHSKRLQPSILGFWFIYFSVIIVVVDVKGLMDQPLVEQLQDKVHASLLEYNNNFHPGEPNRFGNTLLRLPELRSIGTKSLERLFMLSLTGQIHPSLSLSELLHSTKRWLVCIPGYLFAV